MRCLQAARADFCGEVTTFGPLVRNTYKGCAAGAPISPLGRRV